MENDGPLKKKYNEDPRPKESKNPVEKLAWGKYGKSRY